MLGRMWIVGLGNYVPVEISRMIVPRLPQLWQRFTPSRSWTDAEVGSIGYSEVPVSPTPSGHLHQQPLVGNQIAMVAAFGVALTALETPVGPIKVVDFGGYDGKHADLIGSLFPKLTFDWVVVDFPRVVKAMSQRSRPGLRFVSDLVEALASKPDITLASGSLNYVSNPGEVLQSMCARSSLVVLTRLPLWPIQHQTAAIQHTRRRPVEISYPTWFFSEAEFIAEVNRSAEVLLDFDCPDDRAAFAGHYSTYRGLVLATGGRMAKHSK